MRVYSLEDNTHCVLTVRLNFVIFLFVSSLYISNVKEKPKHEQILMSLRQRIHVFDIWRMSGLCYRLAHDCWQWQLASTVWICYSPDVILNMNECEISEIAHQRFREWKYPFSGKEWLEWMKLIRNKKKSSQLGQMRFTSIVHDLL